MLVAHTSLSDVVYEQDGGFGGVDRGGKPRCADADAISDVRPDKRGNDVSGVEETNLR